MEGMSSAIFHESFSTTWLTGREGKVMERQAETLKRSREPHQDLGDGGGQVITQCLRGFLPCKDLKVEDLPIEETLFVTPYNAFLYRLVKIRRDVSALHPMCSANVAGDRATGKPVRGTSFAQYYKCVPQPF